NPPHYAALLEVAGLKRFRDLYMYALSTALPPPEPVVRAADRLREKAGVKVRPFDLRRLPEELQRIKAIQAEAALHERNWAFVPLNEEEVDFLAARLRHLATLSPGLCLFAEVNEEPVAFSLTLPDGNAAVKAAGGSLTTWGLPIGALKMAWAARRVDSVRVLLLGVADAWKRRGLESLLYLETLKVAREQGYAGGELGWVAEDNGPLNRALVSMGARRHKTNRIYEQRLGRGAMRYPSTGPAKAAYHLPRSGLNGRRGRRRPPGRFSITSTPSLLATRRPPRTATRTSWPTPNPSSASSPGTRRTTPGRSPTWPACSTMAGSAGPATWSSSRSTRASSMDRSAPLRRTRTATIPSTT